MKLKIDFNIQLNQKIQFNIIIVVFKGFDFIKNHF